jgi:hypothetical protein
MDLRQPTKDGYPQLTMLPNRDLVWVILIPLHLRVFAWGHPKAKREPGVNP